MRALRNTPTRIGTQPCQPQARARLHSHQGRMRRVFQQLAPETIEQIAVRVAELLRERPATQTRPTLPGGDQADAAPGEPVGLLDASELARRLGVSRAWVYENAERLGAVSLGEGPRARLRFDLQRAKAALRTRGPQPGDTQPMTGLPTSPPLRRPRVGRGKPPSTPLLPVSPHGVRGAFALLAAHRRTR